MGTILEEIIEEYVYYKKESDTLLKRVNKLKKSLEEEGYKFNKDGDMING